MSRRLVVVGCAGSRPLYGFDSRARDERDDDDDDGAELAAAFDSAERALQAARDGELDPRRAAIELERCALAIERHAQGAADIVARAGEDTAVGETTAGSVLDLERSGGTSRSRGTSRDTSYPPGRVAERSATELRRSRSVDHRDDFDSYYAGGNADDALPPELADIMLPAPRTSIMRTSEIAFDERVRRGNAELSRRLNARIDHLQQRPDALAGLL